MGGAFLAIPIKHFDTDDGYRDKTAPPILRAEAIQWPKSITYEYAALKSTTQDFETSSQ
jgi:hypothetical protein